MEHTHLEAAEAAYAAGDWTTAAREYLAAAGGEIEGGGYAFHRAGNALVRLKRFDDAVSVYERALRDSAYGELPTVSANLGTAKAALGDHGEAAEAFRIALASPEYEARYKALQGLGGACYQLGRIDDAAEAYRQAALDSANPDPGRALNNLGLCFMALERPEDAVEAYRAGVDLEGYKGRGRVAANLGVAYATLGRHEKAIASFERARNEFGFELSTSMDAAYRASLEASARPTERGDERPDRGIASTPSAAPFETAFPTESEDEQSRFFTITDEEMRHVDREARRRERLEREPKRPLWMTVLIWTAVAVALAGGVLAGYLFGYGYPTQKMTVHGVLEAYADGDDVATYWVAVPATDVGRAMSALPPQWESYIVGDVERSARTSTVEVTVTLERGGVVTYEFSLAREGVGWKVNGVSTSFSSMNGGV